VPPSRLEKFVGGRTPVLKVLVRAMPAMNPCRVRFLPAACSIIPTADSMA
jgi:hypothetical protein